MSRFLTINLHLSALPKGVSLCPTYFEEDCWFIQGESISSYTSTFTTFTFLSKEDMKFALRDAYWIKAWEILIILFWNLSNFDHFFIIFFSPPPLTPNFFGELLLTPQPTYCPSSYQLTYLPHPANPSPPTYFCTHLHCQSFWTRESLSGSEL